MDYQFINMDYLDSVSSGDPEVINEIVNIFKEQAVEIYDEMKKCLSDKDYRLLGALAHKAKSSASIMGMNDLAQMLKTLEQEAKDGKEPELFEQYVIRFKTETDLAIKELDDYINHRFNNN